MVGWRLWIVYVLSKLSGFSRNGKEKTLEKYCEELIEYGQKMLYVQKIMRVMKFVMFYNF